MSARHRTSPQHVLDISGAFDHPSEKEEIARMHAQTAGIPDLALHAIDDCLAILWCFPADPMEQKNVSPVLPRRPVDRRTRLLEPAKFLAEFPAFGSRNELGYPNYDKPNRGRNQSPITVLVVP